MQYRTKLNARRNECGAALVTALVLLTVMTLLAITSMGTNTLEEKMAANAQEANRAFQTAESGLTQAFVDLTFFDIENRVDDNGTPFDTSDDLYDHRIPNPEFGDEDLYFTEFTYTVSFRQITGEKRGARAGDTDKRRVHFDAISTGETRTPPDPDDNDRLIARSVVHGGAYRVTEGSALDPTTGWIRP